MTWHYCHVTWESYSGGNGTKDSWESLSQGIAYVRLFLRWTTLYHGRTFKRRSNQYQNEQSRCRLTCTTPYGRFLQDIRLVECDEELTIHVWVCKWSVDNGNRCHAREETGCAINTTSAPNNWNIGSRLQYGPPNFILETSHGICRDMWSARRTVGVPIKPDLHGCSSPKGAHLWVRTLHEIYDHAFRKWPNSMFWSNDPSFHQHHYPSKWSHQTRTPVQIKDNSSNKKIHQDGSWCLKTGLQESTW